MVARIISPPLIKSDTPFEVRLVIQHPMETGFRQDMMGALIPKNVIRKLSVTFNSELVFQASLGTGISANPSLQFWMKSSQSGVLKLLWEDDLGVIGEAVKSLEIT
jgi:sulfur-oxidizing protein SoxZ